MIPIKKYKSAQSLIGFLKKMSPCPDEIKYGSVELIYATLWPAISIAYWIAKNKPELMEKDSLSILVVGAGSIDSKDDGAWYRYINYLLGKDYDLKVSLVGPEYGDVDPIIESMLGKVGTRPVPEIDSPSSSFKMTLGEFMKNHSSDEFDMAVFFHSGLQQHHEEWFVDSAFAELINSGIPIMTTYFQIDEVVIDELYFKAYGFELEPLNEEVNPFFLKNSQLMYLGHFIATLKGKAALPTKIVDKETFLMAEDLTLYASSGEPEENYDDLLYLLKRMEVQDAKTGEVLIYVILPFDFLLNPDEGVVYRVTRGGRLIDYFEEALSDELHDNLPGEYDSVRERILWAGRFLREFGILDLLREESENERPDIITLGDVIESIDESELDDYNGTMNPYEEEVRSLSEFNDVPYQDMLSQIEQMIEPKDLEVPSHHKEIVEAMKELDFKKMTTLIAKKPELIDAQTEEGITPMYVACVKDRVDVMNEFLKYDPLLEHKDAEGWPIITEIVRYGANKSLKRFVELGSNLNIQNPMGWTALHIACQYQNKVAFDVLLSAGADSNIPNSLGVLARDMAELFER